MDKQPNQIPGSEALRRQIAQATHEFIAAKNLVPPLTLLDLQQLTGEFLQQHGHPCQWQNWIMVMLNNALWRDIIAFIPYTRRILLLPQCLRDPQTCQATVDEYGLLCEGCGHCVIDSLQQQAEDLGMMSMVAEGSTFVAELLESGSVDAIIGVSCLDALEKAFPYMVNNAIPGVAIPLYRNGCKNTATDVAMVQEAFGNYVASSEKMLNLKQLHQEVQSWFNQQHLQHFMGVFHTPTDEIAREWLLRDGKRHRPFLVAAVAKSLGTPDESTVALPKLAIAIECFHKASLIHDDIEDNDAIRYGQSTLHEQWGVPIALNVGDLLLGDGYRLLAEVPLAADIKARLFGIAATAHMALCRGQGQELQWQRQRQQLTCDQVIDIFRHKTSPAFAAALLFGAVYAGADQTLCEILHKFSDNMGIAYQIRDDLLDFAKDIARQHTRLSILYAIQQNTGVTAAEARHQALKLYNHYRVQTLQVLAPLANTSLKRLLFRVTARILQDVS